MKDETSLDRSLRRLGAIFAAPSLLLHYGHTTPALERGYLRRIGLSKEERTAFMDGLCLQGLMDEGARALIEPAALAGGCDPATAARRLMAAWAGEGD